MFGVEWLRGMSIVGRTRSEFKSIKAVLASARQRAREMPTRPDQIRITDPDGVVVGTYPIEPD